MGLIFSKTKNVVIANGAALSNAFALGDKVADALQMPAAWTAADLTFQVSDDNGVTWTELLDNSGAAVTLSAPSAGLRYNLFPADFQNARCLKIRSGTSATPVNQAAARNVAVLSRRFYPNR